MSLEYNTLLFIQLFNFKQRIIENNAFVLSSWQSCTAMSLFSTAPLVKIKQALTKLKQETIQMDIQIGVMENTLLQSKLKEKIQYD